MHDPALLATAGIQMIPARGGLTSPSPREAVWTAPAEWSADPGPGSALGSTGPVPALIRRCSASVSHFLPWSGSVHCGASGTAAPTRDSEQVIRVKPAVKSALNNSKHINSISLNKHQFRVTSALVPTACSWAVPLFYFIIQFKIKM